MVKGRVPSPRCSATILFALGLCFASGCGKKSESSSGAADAGAPAPTKVTLALDWVPEPEFGGFYAAREGGAYRRHGVGVENPRRWRRGAGVLQMVGHGPSRFRHGRRRRTAHRSSPRRRSGGAVRGLPDLATGHHGARLAQVTEARGRLPFRHARARDRQGLRRVPEEEVWLGMASKWFLTTEASRTF